VLKRDVKIQLTNFVDSDIQCSDTERAFTSLKSLAVASLGQRECPFPKSLLLPCGLVFSCCPCLLHILQTEISSERKPFLARRVIPFILTCITLRRHRQPRIHFTRVYQIRVSDGRNEITSNSAAQRTIDLSSLRNVVSWYMCSVYK